MSTHSICPKCFRIFARENCPCGNKENTRVSYEEVRFLGKEKGRSKRYAQMLDSRRAYQKEKKRQQEIGRKKGLIK